MKFLLVSPFTGASGSAIRFWNIAQALREKGHRVVYADRRAKKAPSLHFCEGVAYYGCPACGVLLLDIVFSFLFYSTIFIRHVDCDVFYALKPAPNNCIPALAARLFGKRVILDVDDLDYAYLAGGAGRVVSRFFFNLFPRMFHLVTYHTPALHDYLAESAHVPERRLYYLAQGVSPVFLPVQRPSVSSRAPGELIYLATLGITSDFDDLLPGLQKLFVRHPAASMSVVGDGCRKAEFERSVAGAGIGERVRFFGTIEHADLPRFVAAHRIGINYMRPVPVNRCRAILKIREYLACGLEVVCNEAGDVDLFRDFIHIEQTIDALFETVSVLLSKPHRMNDAGRAFIELYYRWPGIIDAFLKRIGAL
ncbi:MAG: glycosyltransferase [Chitinispirillaceae bacterium]|nr:glycosyltransferase [Chitinispirillaceae bacterium]